MDIVLSIIIPAYNMEAWIGRRMKSLMDQMTDNVELIVVDDGSTDQTHSCATEAIAINTLQNVRLYAKDNGGVSSARNFGLDRAKGTFVYFLDADDYVSDDFIVHLLQFIASNVYDVVHWPYDLVDDHHNTLLTFPFEQSPGLVRTGLEVLEDIVLHKATRIWTASAIYRRSFLVEHGIRYTEGCSAGEDVEFIYAALTYAHAVVFTDKLKSFYVQHAASVMSSYSIKKFSAVFAMERAGKRFAEQGDEPGFQALARQMSGFESLHSYAGTYTMCLRHLIHQEHVRPAAAMRRLSQEIEALYPGLVRRMKDALSAREKGWLPDRLDVFRISPVIYMYLSNMRQPATSR